MLPQGATGPLTSWGSFLPATSRIHSMSGINYPSQFVLAANPQVIVNMNIPQLYCGTRYGDLVRSEHVLHVRPGVSS